MPVPFETINGFDTGLLEDFVRAFAQAAELTVHVHLRYGRSPHHVCEAEFKALATALGDACALTGRGGRPVHEGHPVREPRPSRSSTTAAGTCTRSPARSRTWAPTSVVAERPRGPERAAPGSIPGVGHFGQCVRALRAAGFEAPIRDAVAAGTPVFGVCVGMQILFEASEEDADPGPRGPARAPCAGCPRR